MPFRTYSLIATIGVVPLVLMVIALIVFQFRNEHQALLQELEDQAVEHNALLSNVIKTVEDHVWRLRSMGRDLRSQRRAALAGPLCRSAMPAI